MKDKPLPMSIAKARFIVRSELTRIQHEAGPQRANDLTNAIEMLINDAVQQAINARVMKIGRAIGGGCQ